MKTPVVLLAVGLGMAIAGPGLARPAMGKRMMRRPVVSALAPGEVGFQTEFAMLAAKPVMRSLPESQERTTTGTSIAAIAGGALVIDDETGTLTLLDAGARQLDSAAVGARAGLLAVDRRRKIVFVANRSGDTIEVYRYGRSLKKTSQFVTAAEPFGLALTPDGKALLVTTVAGRTLQALDTSSGDELWSLEIGPEARAVAVSPDGAEAVVSFLGSGAIARVALSTRRLRFEAIGVTRSPTEPGANLGRGQHSPERFARNAFAATFVGDTAVVAYQQSTPMAAMSERGEARGTYGGSAEGNPPIVHRLAFMPRGWNSPGRAHVRMQMPRAMAYDAGEDSLLIADLANEEVIRLRNVTKGEMSQDTRFSLRRPDTACGPTGVAMAAGGTLWVHCSLSKRVAMLDVHGGGLKAWSPELATSKLTASAQRGRELFHKGGDRRLSTSGGLACANCHPEGRNDGLSWRIEGTDLQTPLLAGRMLGTHPFKWDGADRDLHTSLMHTVVRLGGSGIAPSDATDLKAYLESMEGVRVARMQEGELTATQHRGKALFNSKELGCRSCHSGKNYSDGKSYEFGDDLEKVNTPSLLGLGASAPYYHDGSAANLKALVLGNASIRGMGHMESLDDKEVDDLVAFLETL